MALEDSDGQHCPPHSIPSPQITPTLKLITKFHRNTKGQFQCCLNAVPVQALADSGSARCLASSHVMELVMGPYYYNHIEKKTFPPIYDASSKQLKILGAIQLQVRIEKYTSSMEFVVYQGNNPVVLIGFLEMADKSLVVYPRLGLFQAIAEQGEQCFLVQGDQEPEQEVVVEGQHVLLPVHAVGVHVVPPGSAANIPAIVKPPFQEAFQQYKYSTLCFHSESLQREVPLDKISVYYQYQNLNHDLRLTLRFCNHAKSEITICDNELIAHAQEVSQCDLDEIERSDDQIAKYIKSIFNPVLFQECPQEDMLPPGNQPGQPCRQACPPRNASAHPTGGKGQPPRKGNFSRDAPPKESKASKEQILMTSSPKVNHQPSYMGSLASSPYTYKTGLHEIKGPSELHHFSKEDIKIDSQVPEERNFIYQMYDKYKEAVSVSEYDCGTFKGPPLTFKLKKDSVSYHAKPYPLNKDLQPAADALIGQLLAAGIVTKCTQPAHIISPIHFVAKGWPDLPAHLARYPGQKDTSKPRKLRAVINHKVLNSQVQLPARFPQATIPEVLRKLHYATIAGSSDLRASFYSMRIHEDMKPFLAFQYKNDLLTFLRAPMGFLLSSFWLAAQTSYMKFQYNLTQCEFVCDDVLIWGSCWENYADQVERYFKALVATGMKLNSQKSNWACRDKIPVLGYILHLPTKSLLASPTKIKGILSMCPPKDKRSTKRFVGAVSFLSQFIFGLQQLLKPLHEIASPKTPFVWTSECHKNWETIRRSIAQLPALRLPSPNFDLHLHVDSSPNVCLALNWLFTQQSDPEQPNKHFLVQFGSKCLKPEHLALSQCELEALGILASLQSDKHLVHYSNVVLHTDCRGLVFLKLHEQSQSKLHRWLLFLNSLPLTISFTPATNYYIRLVDMIGRGRTQVEKLMKTPKPLAKHHIVFPVYDFSGLPQLPFDQCMQLIREIIDTQKSADLDVHDYPIMVGQDGIWSPLGGLLEKSAKLPKRSKTPPQNREVTFVQAARCTPRAPPPSSHASPHLDRAAAALSLERGDKVESWVAKHFDKLCPPPPNFEIATSYAVSVLNHHRHHLPQMPTKSTYTNPISASPKGPTLISKYDIRNLNTDEKQPALRFLLLVNSELKTLPLASIKTDQKTDKFCADQITALEEGQHPAGFALFNGLLLRVCRQPSLKLQIVLPYTLAAKFLLHLHENTSLFHLSHGDLQKMFSRYFFCKKLHTLAKNICEKCHLCSLFNIQRHKKTIHGRRFIVSRPRQLLHADVVTLFTGTGPRSQNKSYLVICDYFSYLTSTYMLKSPETSQQLTSHLLHYFSSHSVPAGICLDHASVHENVLSQALAILNIAKYQPSPRRPAPNLCERVISYLQHKVRLLYRQFRVKDEHLSSLVNLAIHVFNTCPLKSLEENSPYQVHFGDNSAIGVFPTTNVTKNSSLPPYLKTLARLQSCLWDSLNNLRRQKEQKYVGQNDPRRRPMFQPGDLVRIRKVPDQTQKHHKTLPRYSQTQYKIIRCMPRSLNYLLLKLTDKNQLLYGFYSKTPIPKRCLVYAKEDRLKRCRQADCKDPLALKLFSLLSEVALRQHQTPKDFILDPQVGKTVTIDAELQKLTNFVLQKQLPCPKNPHPLLQKHVEDSIFGNIPPPSSDFLKDKNTGEGGGGRNSGAVGRGGHYQYVNLRPSSNIPAFGTIIQKILSPGLSKMYQAAGCKPFSLSTQKNDNDDDDDQESLPNRHLMQHINHGGGAQAPQIQPPPPPPPPPHSGGGGGAQLANPPPPSPPALLPQAQSNLQHASRLPPLATHDASGAGAKHNIRTRSCSPDRPLSSLSKHSSRSRSQSVASTTNAVDMDWDYYEYRQSVDKNSRYEQFPDSAEASGSAGEHGNKYQVPRPVPHAGAIQHQQLDNEEEEEGDFFEANVSLSPQHGAHGAHGDDPNIRYPNSGTLGPPLVARPEGGQPLTPALGLPALPPGAAALDPGHNDQHLDQLGHDDQPGHIGNQPPDQLAISPIKTPVQRRTLQFPPHYYSDKDSPSMQDLGLPRLPVAPYGHQVFDNCEMGSSTAPSKRKKRPSVLSKHLQDTRPLSSRRPAAKVAAEKITATSKPKSKKSTKSEK